MVDRAHDWEGDEGQTLEIAKRDVPLSVAHVEALREPCMEAGSVTSTLRPKNASLKRRGGILLLGCYEMGHQPLSLALPLAALEEAGFAPAAVDLSLEDLSRSVVEEADLVAISAPMHTALRIGAQAADVIRQINPSCRILFYGLYAALNREYLQRQFSAVCIGRNEEAELVRLAIEIHDSRTAPESVRQLKVDEQPEPKPGRLELLPRRSSFPPLERYARLEDEGGVRIAGYVEASRGCLHRCTHCPIPPVYSGRFEVHSPKMLLEDIAQQVQAGATHITFGDPDFLNGPGHSLALVREMHDRFPLLTFDCTIKIEHVVQQARRFRELKRCGCLFVVSAVESLSERVLKILEKGHTRQDIERALHILDEAGIPMRPTWVPFTPWTTIDDYREMLAFVCEQDLIGHIDPVQYSVRLLIPPGSLLLRRPELAPHLGRLHPDEFAYEWRHPDPFMDRLQEQVAALVEGDTATGTDATQTFDSICHLAGVNNLAVRETPPSGGRRNGSSGLCRKKAPRLTEPWFC